jgi:hypothetical protein
VKEAELPVGDDEQRWRKRGRRRRGKSGMGEQRKVI